MVSEPCRMCGGDGRIQNSFGNTTTCPGCHGSGRRSEATGFHDVTKTKPSHHKPTTKAAIEAKAQWPTTAAGDALATEVRDSKGCAAETKAKLIREIMDHEALHGQCTQTFVKKIRKQVRPKALGHRATVAQRGGLRASGEVSSLTMRIHLATCRSDETHWYRLASTGTS